MRLFSRLIIRVESKQVKVQLWTVAKFFFCQITMGSSLNSNVPEGRSVALLSLNAQPDIQNLERTLSFGVHSNDFCSIVGEAIPEIYRGPIKSSDGSCKKFGILHLIFSHD